MAIIFPWKSGPKYNISKLEHFENLQSYKQFSETEKLFEKWYFFEKIETYTKFNILNSRLN